MGRQLVIRRRIVLIYWAIALGFFTPDAAFAYIDPATTTYIIQIITALVVTIGVSLSIFLYRFRMISTKVRYGLYGLWYRLRTKGDTVAGGGLFARLLRRGDAAPRNDGGGTAAPRNDGGGTAAPSPCAPSDPSPCVPYIAPVYVLPGAERPPTVYEMRALGEPTDIKKIGRPEEKSLLAIEKGFSVRVWTALPVSLCLSLCFVLFGCIVLVIENPADIVFSLNAVLPALALTAVVCFAAALLFISLFRGRVYMVVISLAAAMLIAGFIQGLILNKGLGELTGDAIEWGLYSSTIVWNTLLWGAIFIFVFCILHYVKGAHRFVLVFVPIILIVVQAIGLGSLVEGAANKTGVGRGSIAAYWEESPERLTFEGIFSPATEKNVIIIVLDRLDQEIIYDVITEDPHFFDNLEGFTMFDDHISYSAKTFPAITEMFTGYKFRWEQSDGDYYSTAWAEPNFLKTLAERGVDVKLYTYYGFVYDNVDQIRGIASNIAEVKESVNSRIALVKLLKLSAFRHMPMAMKPLFWISPTEFVDAVVFTGETMPYLQSDFEFYNSLIETGLSLSDRPLGFSFIHLNGPHPPLNMDENAQRVENSTLVKQTKGSFKIVNEYLEQLKELGLYEQATIIVMADHGIPVDAELEKPVHSALFIKRSGISDMPLTVNHAPVCPDQLPGTVMEGFFGDAIGYAPGYFDIPENADIVREYGHKRYLYEISGDGRVFENWHFTREYIDEWNSKAG